jgi:hypothetical protein
MDVQHQDVEFTSYFSLLRTLQEIGEQGALDEARPGLRSIDTYIAASALFETLFNKRTIGNRDENSTNILIDSFKDEYLYDLKEDLNLKHLKESNPYLMNKFKDHESLTEAQIAQLHRRSNNIICTFDILHLIGWKYHESQQQPKERGSASFSLRDVVDDLNEEGDVDEFGEPK